MNLQRSFSTLVAVAALAGPASASSKDAIIARNVLEQLPRAAATQDVGSIEIIQGCRSLIGTGKPSGFYWTTFDTSTQVLMYCDNQREYNGVVGGWTLVWSNLRGGTGKLATDMAWGASIETLPRYRGAPPGPTQRSLQSFEVFTGLRWWREIADPARGGRGELLYEWAHDYSLDPHRIIDRAAACRFSLSSQANWTITFNDAPCQVLSNGDLPGLFTSHNGRQWSARDRDNDTWNRNCAQEYAGPWWHYDCWNGSILGGGEREAHGRPNGAYWVSSDTHWGKPDGTGAGNGWIYIR